MENGILIFLEVGNYILYHSKAYTSNNIPDLYSALFKHVQVGAFKLLTFVLSSCIIPYIL